MSADDPILDSKTVAQYIVALRNAFGIDLPSVIPPPGPLSELWAASVHVVSDAGPHISYRATTPGPTPLPEWMPALVTVDVIDHAPPPPAPPVDTTSGVGRTTPTRRSAP